MNRRVIIKTVLLCTGVFLILLSAVCFYISNRFVIDTGKTVRVVTASTSIREGATINESMLGYREIKASSATSQMLSDFRQAIGRKTANPIPEGEYLRSSELIEEKNWFGDDEKKIVLPLERDNSIAYAVEKGSYIDIKCWSEGRAGVPKTVLSKVLVHEVLDESGQAIEKAFGNRKAYIVLVLGSKQRDRLYTAMSHGKLIYEVYCSRLQKPAKENFNPDTYS